MSSFAVMNETQSSAAGRTEGGSPIRHEQGSTELHVGASLIDHPALRHYRFMENLRILSSHWPTIDARQTMSLGEMTTSFRHLHVEAL